MFAAAPSPGYAFAAGMLATLNPCGFTLLPAYLSYYLGRADDEEGVSIWTRATSSCRKSRRARMRSIAVSAVWK